MAIHPSNSDPGTSCPPAPAPAHSDRDDLRLGLVRQIVARRSVRPHFLDADLFGEPAWDMLLDLYVSARRRRPVSVTGLCLSSGVPTSTALRWIRELTDRGLIERHADPEDGRRSHLTLSARAHAALEAYLDANLPSAAA